MSLSRTQSTLIHAFLWCLPSYQLQSQIRLLPLNSRLFKLKYSTWTLFISQNQHVSWSIKIKRQRMEQRIHPCSINQKREGEFGVLLLSSNLMFMKGCLQSMRSVSLKHRVHEQLSAVTELRVSQNYVHEQLSPVTELCASQTLCSRRAGSSCRSLCLKSWNWIILHYATRTTTTWRHLRTILQHRRRETLGVF